MANNIVDTSTDTSALPIIQPKENELLNLTHAVIEWKKLQGELIELRAAMGERRKKMKVLEEIILRIMKNHNIGALDLKNSGGRVLYKKKKSKSSLAGKNLENLMAQFFNSQERASEVMKFIDDHREVVTRDGLAYIDA